MIIMDTQGATFDSRDVELTVEEFDDAELGRLAKVRSVDGTFRLVRASELAAAANDETVSADLKWVFGAFNSHAGLAGDVRPFSTHCGH